MILAMYTTWHFRNGCLFKGENDIKKAISFFEKFVEFSSSAENILIRNTKKEVIPVVPQYYLTINTDITIGISCFIIVMTVRDREGKLVYLASEKVQNMEPNLAKLKAIGWATSIAMDLKLGFSFWFCDSLSTISTINSEEEPCSWDTYLEASTIRRRFRSNPWSMH
ncbi:hypothetical protein FNV43_RR10435 [Rhamnella rubrinervis]|uniref:RNase H type-1 domain-containing protein n=1 Tax=Rhamnella rubrinervis TaxID=2594499 RepID=A0A8K0MKS1_9ROSA|nr:hypothetical protein FNV43_RR10435 [Rhamnella rubrinervis]